METEKLYISNPELTESEALIVDSFTNKENLFVLILDKTIFYPSAGGQPCDIGEIVSDTGTLTVTNVRYGENGEIFHIGGKSGELNTGDFVTLRIDPERRSENSRYHSAGHLLAKIVEDIYPSAKAIKGFHDPVGAYIEYELDISQEEKDILPEKINMLVKKYVSENREFVVKMVSYAEAEKICPFVPSFLPKDQDVRVVIVDGWAMTCGGTHVKDISALKNLTVRKVNSKKGNLRISYIV